MPRSISNLYHRKFFLYDPYHQPSSAPSCETIGAASNAPTAISSERSDRQRRISRNTCYLKRTALKCVAE